MRSGLEARVRLISETGRNNWNEGIYRSLFWRCRMANLRQQRGRGRGGARGRGGVTPKRGGATRGRGGATRGRGGRGGAGRGRGGKEITPLGGIVSNGTAGAGRRR